MTDFDWVGALAGCSLSSIFERLKLELQSDVDKRNQLGRGPLEFKLVSHTSGATVVAGLAGETHDAVLFRLRDTAIEVVGRDGNVRFKATPTLNDKGECRLKINGQECELWHFRKLALEDAFFGGT